MKLELKENMYIRTDRKIFKFLKVDEKQWLDKEDIKSIVTKEQFEQMAYKVGD